jgi:uncharacterized protein YhaN
MPGETELAPSGWTIDTLLVHLLAAIAALKELTSQRFEAQEKAVTAAMAASDAAIAKAENNAEKWRNSANEWRGAMNDRERDFMRQDAFDRSHADLIERVDALSKSVQEKHEIAVAALNEKIDMLAARVGQIAVTTGVAG